MPFDAKWSCVAKKEKHCDPEKPADRQQGDNGDHVALGPEHRLVVCVVPGQRTEDKTHQLVQDFRARTGGRLMNLMTSDEYPVYKTALFAADAVAQAQPRTGRPGRSPKPRQIRPKGLK